MNKIILLGVVLSTILVGCITSVDGTLPYDRLPEITVATEVGLVASPSDPTSYLPVDPIPAGGQVSVFGADPNSAWLLVLHEDALGWMPTVFSRTNVGKLKAALVIEPLSGSCTGYLGAINRAERRVGEQHQRAGHRPRQHLPLPGCSGVRRRFTCHQDHGQWRCIGRQLCACAAHPIERRSPLCVFTERSGAGQQGGIRFGRRRQRAAVVSGRFLQR